MVNEETAGKENIASESVRKSCVWCRVVIPLCIGLVLGGIGGGRYLSQGEGIHILLGTFLPPHSENWEKKERDQLTPGMEKDEVIGILNLLRCEILCGASLDRFLESRGRHYGVEKENVNTVVEIWLVPRRRIGITDYLLLAFNKAQRLCDVGIDEFMKGYKATR